MSSIIRKRWPVDQFSSQRSLNSTRRCGKMAQTKNKRVLPPENREGITMKSINSINSEKSNRLYMATFILFTLVMTLMVVGCSSSGTETVNVTNVLSSHVDFAGSVTFPSNAGITVTSIKSRIFKTNKITELQVYSPQAGKGTVISSAGRYVLTEIPRQDHYFFQVINGSGTLFLTAVSRLNGALNIDTDSTALELAYAEAKTMKSGLTLLQFQSKLSSSALTNLKNLINSFLATNSTATTTYSIKGDSTVINEAKKVASATVALL